MNLLLRTYSLVFHLPLALFLFAVGSFSYLQNVKNLNIEMLPWTGATLRGWVLTLGLLGLVSVLLAILRKARVVFALYAVFIFLLSLYAVFASGHRFDGASDFRWGLAFVAGAFGAMMGSFVHAVRR